MKQGIFKIVSNEALTPQVWRMVLAGDTEGIRPGQFVEIALPGRFLRRPISVCNAESGELTIIYKVVGKGTADMAEMKPGMQLDVLVQLGNGYNLSLAGEHPLLLGGGVGVPPLYMAAKELRAQQKEVDVVLGFNTASEVFCEDAFRQLGCNVVVTTADGSYGKKGFVTDALPEHTSYFYACGPLPMLKAIERSCKADGEMSYEERMGCGFGICVGCTVQTTDGPRRVCKDGPVFKKNSVI